MIEFDIPASQKDRKLPMIVNLRGDEELVEVFNWDADQAMEFLAIKRSRLTQISGRELRVGRIRRDRYLRPVYRESDVRDYQEWTRATATHQSSSRAVEQAIDSLDDRFSDLFVVLQEKLQQFEQRSSLLLIKETHKVTQALHENFLAALDAEPRLLQSLSERLDESQRLLKSGQQALQQTLKASGEELELLRSLIQNFYLDLRELLVNQQSLRRELGESQAQFGQWLQRQELWQRQQDQFQDQQAQLLLQSFQQMQDLQIKLLDCNKTPIQGRTLRLRRPKPSHLRLHRPAKIIGLTRSVEQDLCGQNVNLGLPLASLD